MHLAGQSVGVAALLLQLLLFCRRGEGQLTLSSYSPTNGPVTGGTVISIKGTGFVTTGPSRSRCNFLLQSGRGSEFSMSNRILNSTHLSCTMPNISFLFPSPLPPGGVIMRLSVTGFRESSNSVNFLVYNQSFLVISSISPNQALSNSSNGTQLTITGQGFINTGEIVCALETNINVLALAIFESVTSLQCTLPLEQSAIRIAVVVSLNGQLAGAIPSETDALLFTFYSPPPLAIGGYFSSSYAQIFIRFDREIEIGPEQIGAVSQDISTDNGADLSIDCVQVFSDDTLSLLSALAVCSWENSQQRTIVVQLSVNSEIRQGSVVAIRNDTLRTRHVLFSRLVSGTVTIAPSLEGPPPVPIAVLETPSSIPRCGEFVISGEKSLFGGNRRLEYEWRVGIDGGGTSDEIMGLDGIISYVPVGFTPQSRLVIPSGVFYSDTSSGLGSGSGLAPLDTYYVQLTVRNHFGLSSTSMNVTTSRALTPTILLIGEQGTRRVQAWKDILLEGRIQRLTNDCALEIRVSGFLWSLISPGGTERELEGVRMDTSVLSLPPYALLSGTVYEATFTVMFNDGETSSISVTLETEEGVEARINGGTRRALGNAEPVNLEGSVSMIERSANTSLNVSWSCSAISVPELQESSPSCANFRTSDGLILTLSPGQIPSGGYSFTLTLTLTGTQGTLLQSSSSQVIVIFPHPVPSVNIVRVQHEMFESFLVHRKFSLSAELFSPYEGSLEWSSEYVEDYGRLQLHNSTRSPLLYSVCPSLPSCPHSEASSNLYTSDLLTTPPQSSPLVNRLSFVLPDSLLLPRNSYRFKVTARDSLDRVGFAEIDVHTESLPSSGSVVIQPSTGTPLSTVFVLRALGWTDEPGDTPYLYRLGYRYLCSAAGARSGMCVEWFSGLTQENEFVFILPDIDSTNSPRLLLQVLDNNGAVQEIEHSFSDLILSELVQVEGTGERTSLSSVTDVLADIGSLVTGGHWVQGLAHFVALVSSVDIDHETLICEGSQSQLSSRFQLSSSEFVELKMRMLPMILDLHRSFFPNSQSYFRVSLSLLERVTRTHCNMSSELDFAWNTTHIAALTSMLEDIVRKSNNFSKYGVLSQRGISQEDAQTVLNIYEQLSYSQGRSPANASANADTRDNLLTDSLTRILSTLGYGLCTRQRIGEQSVMLMNEFADLKSSLINLPPDYTTGGCVRSEGCRVEHARVDFGAELFARYLQWVCASDEGVNEGGGDCSGLCVTSALIHIDIFYRGSPFSSQLKTPILHLSLLNPSDGSVVTDQATTSLPELDIPLVALFADSANLRCVIWNDGLVLWTSDECDVVGVRGSRVVCRCSLVGDLFYTVLERCPDGQYGSMCNETCPQGLWGSECSMSCDCNERGTCSAADGRCDCDAGWIGLRCQERCPEGSYGKLCVESCDCRNDALCDPVDGTCYCTPGWIGPICNISCSEGFYGNGCVSRCQCRNNSECEFTSGSCTCQAGFAGTTCHDHCPEGSYGVGCELQCECFSEGTRSCDHINGSCDCQDMWMGPLCSIQVTPPTVPVPSFQIWWVVVALLFAILAAVGVVIIVVVIAMWRKRKRKKVLPVTSTDKESHLSDGTEDSDDLVMFKTTSLHVLVPDGKKLNDVFDSTSPVEDFEEPLTLEGKFRWQIIRILSEAGSEGRKSELIDGEGRIFLESRDSSRPESKTQTGTGGEVEEGQETGREKGTPNNQQDQMEEEYTRGVYLSADATLRDLRNQFVDSGQLEMEKEGRHFQFLRSDVPGDRIEVDTEDEVLLCQIEDSLLEKRTMYIETIDPSLAAGELCICGKFADLECTNCKKRGYCGRECQEKDWPQHESFCKEVSSKRERKKRRRKSKSRGSSRRSSGGETPLFSEDTCVCGKEAEYECSGCRKQGYCSDKCQTEDWSFHEYYCNQPGSSTRKTRVSSRTSSKLSRGMLQTVYEEPESSIETK